MEPSFVEVADELQSKRDFTVKYGPVSMAHLLLCIKPYKGTNMMHGQPLL